MNRVKNIHFVGIKGVGMTPLAIIAKQAGFTVSGCDVEDEFITDDSLRKIQINPFVGFSVDHLKNVDLVVTTGAHGGLGNPEVLEAKRKGIDVLTQGQVLGKFMNGNILNRNFEGISVAGSHGKTTTAGIIATVLKEAKLDPSYSIGTSEIFSLGLPGHFGKGNYFIVEADEYANDPLFDKTPKFLSQYPKIAVFTNIELDHPDIYNSVDDVKKQFLLFSENINNNGSLIVNGDDMEIRSIFNRFNKKNTTFGFSPKNDFVVKKISLRDSQAFFWVEKNGLELGEFTINTIGEKNVVNALAAIAVGFELGISLETIKRGIAAFRGSKRRLELVGKTSTGALIFDDYAHHPTEIKSTLRSLKGSFPNTKVICVFQPHTYSRTKKMFEQFSSSFTDAYQVIITDIYSSKREKEDLTVSSEKLVSNMNKIRDNAIFLPGVSNVIEYIEQKRFEKDTIIVTMGAGDIYKAGRIIAKMS